MNYVFKKTGSLKLLIYNLIKNNELNLMIIILKFKYYNNNKKL